MRLGILALNIRPGVALALAAGLSLALVACSNSVTTGLELTVAAAEAAVNTISALNPGAIPPATAAALTGYLDSVLNFAEFATTELASSDSGAIKAAKIASEGAKLAAPDLAAGSPAVVVAVIRSVSDAVLKFLASVQGAQAQLVAAGSGLAFADPPAKKGKVPKLPAADAEKLKVRIRAARARIKR